jgi:hypothetical protein
MGFFSKAPVYSQKSMGYQKASKSPVMQKILSNKSTAKVLSTTRKRDEFYKVLKSKGAGGVTKTELQEVMGHFRSGKGKYITKKDAQEIAGTFFASSSDRYKYVSSGDTAGSGRSTRGITTATNPTVSSANPKLSSQATISGKIQSLGANMKSIIALPGNNNTAFSQNSSSNSENPVVSSSDNLSGDSDLIEKKSSSVSSKKSQNENQDISTDISWLGKYGKANITSNIILKGTADPNQGKALRRALSREEIEKMSGNNQAQSSFSRALQATNANKNKTN